MNCHKSFFSLSKVREIAIILDLAKVSDNHFDLTKLNILTIIFDLSDVANNHDYFGNIYISSYGRAANIKFE